MRCPWPRKIVCTLSLVKVCFAIDTRHSEGPVPRKSVINDTSLTRRRVSDRFNPMEKESAHLLDLKMENATESLPKRTMVGPYPILSDLHDEVVEKILAMVPFPELLKVRTLSKTWYSKFPGPVRRSVRLKLSGDSDFLKSSSRAFQNSVSSVSWQWSAYSPVIVGDNGLLGYDAVQKVWQGLCTANLKEIVGRHFEPWLVSSQGPLLCGVSQAMDSHGDLTVTNVLTRRRRRLPSHPIMRVPSLVNLICDGPDFYKVFLVTEDPHEGPDDDCDASNCRRLHFRCVSSQVFDSRTRKWTLKQTKIPVATSFAWRSCSVHHKGIVYCLSGDDRCPISHPMQLWAHNLESGVWSEIRHPFKHMVNRLSGTPVVADLSRFQIFDCGGKILIVLALDPKKPFEDVIAANSIFIYELDPDSRMISEKYSGPSVDLVGNVEHIASDGENIYFCTLDLTLELPVVAFNLKGGGWSSVVPDFAAGEPTSGEPLVNKRWAGFAFQPGLNPFIIP